MTREEHCVRLMIEDDGVGIGSTVNPQRSTFGLAGMRERISTLGGTFRMVSRKGQGTKINVAVPITAQGTLQDRVRPIAVSTARSSSSVVMAGTGTTD